MPANPASKSSMKTLKSAGSGMEPCGSPLMTDNQPDVTPFIVTHCAQPVSQLLCLWWCVYPAKCWTFCSRCCEKQHWWLLKSKKMITLTVFPWSMRWRILSLMGRTFPLMNPCWLWMMSVMSFRYFSTTHRIISKFCQALRWDWQVGSYQGYSSCPSWKLGC